VFVEPESALSFVELVREYQHMVFSLALHFLRDRETAEELAQDVFLLLYRKLDELESREHVRFWLRRVTSHRCIDEARKRKLRPKFNLQDIPEPAARRTAADPFLSDQLQRLITALPERARMVVILRFQEDMDPAEIAETVGLPVSTIKSLLHRSLITLREKMRRRLQNTNSRVQEANG